MTPADITPAMERLHAAIIRYQQPGLPTNIPAGYLNLVYTQPRDNTPLFADIVTHLPVGIESLHEERPLRSLFMDLIYTNCFPGPYNARARHARLGHYVVNTRFDHTHVGDALITALVILPDWAEVALRIERELPHRRAFLTGVCEDISAAYDVATDLITMAHTVTLSGAPA